MNILLASAEVAPFAKAGGLADMALSFPVEWKKFGQNPIVILPKYGSIDVYKWSIRPTDIIINVPMGYWTEYGHVWYGKLPDSDVPIYLIENADYFNRDGIYGNPEEYPDNDRRFIFFSRAVFEVAKALNFKPDIIHAHDYHTAFTMAFLKSHYRYDPLFENTAGIYTIHNLAYQGWFNPQRAMEFASFPYNDFYAGSWFEMYGSVNAMKTGILFADKITTVSPTYSNEIRSEGLGEGLQNVLNAKGPDLIGVLNGAYYNEWSPEVDNQISLKYSVNNLDNKKINKNRFLNEHNMGEWNHLETPLVGMVTRLTEQKGIDLLMGLLEDNLYHNRFRFALLGSGESKYVDYFNYLAWKYPGRALIHLGYNNTIAHKIIASSDYLIVPSRFEPCGLTQMYALKYGTIPIVRQTGGLADTVFEYEYENQTGNGFSFIHYNVEDFSFALKRALDIYSNEPHWTKIRQNAMRCDFSSARSAMEYLKVFNWALEKVRGY